MTRKDRIKRELLELLRSAEDRAPDGAPTAFTLIALHHADDRGRDTDALDKCAGDP